MKDVLLIIGILVFIDVFIKYSAYLIVSYPVNPLIDPDDTSNKESEVDL